MLVWNNSPTQAVALRKESVDRNGDAWVSLDSGGGSLSARRAWIEISKIFLPSRCIMRRSPQGERG